MPGIIDNSMPNFTEAIKSFFVATNGNRVRVIGESMWPSIKNNQEVDISYNNIVLKPGFCYAFLYGNRIIVHRFVLYKNGKAIFIGDRSSAFEAISPDCIIGRVGIRQNLFIIKIIAFLNIIFIINLFFFQKRKLLRWACILILTKGIKYA